MTQVGLRFFKPSTRNLLIKQHNVPSDHSISIISETAKNLFKDNRKKKELYNTTFDTQRAFVEVLELGQKSEPAV